MYTVEKRRAQPGYLSAEQIFALRAHCARVIFPVSGRCLEGAGIEDGGWVAVDFTRRPRREEVCLCSAVFPGTGRAAVMLKAYMGAQGARELVRTRRGGQQLDLGMEAAEIYGVVTASWDREGALLWTLPVRRGEVQLLFSPLPQRLLAG